MMGTFLGAPLNKDYNALGSVLGSPLLGNYHIYILCIYIYIMYIYIYIP